MKEKSSFNYIYKITNTINDKIYIGVHKTYDLNDGYMGSGTRLCRAIKKYGIEHFKKDILEYFDTYEDALQREAEIVDEEFVKRKDTYNMTCGGGSFYHTKGTVLIKTEDGTTKRISREEYYKNKDNYNTPSSGKVPCIDDNGKIIQVTKEEYYKNKDKYKSRFYNLMMVIDLNGINRRVSCEEYFKNKDNYRTPTSNKVIVKDSDENTFMVNKNDPRYISGELIPLWKGLKHSEESKRKIGAANSIRQKGKFNSQYGKCWIYNNELKQSKSIKKEELEKYIEEGWVKGRKMIF